MAIVNITSESLGAVRTGSGPLKALDSTNSGVGEAVVYPKDLGSSRLNHYVLFSVKDITPQGLEKIKKTIDDAYAGATSISTLLQEKETGLDPNLAQQQGQSGFGTALKALSEIMDIQKNRATIEKYIGLYMPDTLKDNYSSIHIPGTSITSKYKPVNYISPLMNFL
jgi:hypothetical protein